MDYDFRTFSTRSFERFSQALAAHVLGAGIMVFGDGPDGGREAAFEGKLDFPTKADPWNGYVVMQAKFLQLPGSPGEDANWLVTQLEAELKKFLAPKSKLRKPKYYILVSNARLSPQPASPRGKGGIAKIDAVFAKYKKRLGLESWHVWHCDQISTYLSSADGLRRTYSAWLTPSDVISDLLEASGSRRHEVGEALYRYLVRDLRTHQPVRLQQAGHSGEASTMIEDVFVDLPFKPMGGADNNSDKPLLKELLDRARDKLDRDSVDAQAQVGNGRPERVLLIGGPGQGKSTVSQFMAQVLRANVLRAHRPGGYSVEIQRIVDGTIESVHSVIGDQPLPQRIPFKIDLPSFADRLSQNVDGRLTLLQCLANDVSKISDASIEVEDIRRWIRQQPTTLFLDGLDEVPPSANRLTVVRAISEFWDEVHDADLQMVVTTRPQGYNDDLDPSLYVKLVMMPLGPDEAIAYAARLAENRLADSVQRERVMDRLRHASRSPTTSRLMVSPLQVAILLALIDQRGDAPSDRWTLFDKYFAVVLEREQGKVGTVGETMRRWNRQIVTLHHKAGFLLHVDAETHGSSEAYLTNEELSNLVHHQLQEEGFDGQELDAIKSELLAASTERLVLLVQREEHRFSFEVRSLQEFMAAAYIMAGPELIVQSRLQTIANRKHWLHVFQIASSKCFAVSDVQHLRDTVVAICQGLNASEDPLDRYLRTGSRLALSLLDDGLAFDAPRYRNILTDLAIEILMRGPEALPDSLATHCGVNPTRSREILLVHMTSTMERPRHAALLLLLRLAVDDVNWALEWLTREVSQSEQAAAQIVALGANLHQSDALTTVLRSAIGKISPSLYLTQADELDKYGLADQRMRDDALPFLAMFGWLRDEFTSRFVSGELTQLSFSFTSIEVHSERESIYADIPMTPNWEVLHEAVAFHRKPSAAALSSLIRKIVERDWKDVFLRIQDNLPWPLATALALGREPGSLSEVADKVNTGDFGDIADWLEAEARWHEKGFRPADFDCWAERTYFGPDVGKIGAPHIGILQFDHNSESLNWLDGLIAQAMRSTGVHRAELRRMVAFIVSVTDNFRPLSLDEAAFIIEIDSFPKTSRRLDMGLLLSFPENLILDAEIMDALNIHGSERQVFHSVGRSRWKKEVILSFVASLDTRPGLLPLISGAAASSKTPLEWIEIPEQTLSTLIQHPILIIEGCARVLQLKQRRLCLEDVERVFEISNRELFPLTFLHNMLESGKLDRELQQSAGMLVAEHLNAHQDVSNLSFFKVLSSIADQRLAPFGQEACWKSLNLGEALYRLVGRRGR